MQDIKPLLERLGRFFPMQAAEGTDVQRIVPYHKSVLDWFLCHRDMDTQGHMQLARVCAAMLAQELPPLSDGNAQRSADEDDSAALHNAVQLWGTSTTGGWYALRHAVAHACRSDSGGLLKTLLLNLTMWQAAYAVGK